MATPASPDTLNYAVAGEAFADLVGKSGSASLNYATPAGEAFSAATTSPITGTIAVTLAGLSIAASGTDAPSERGTVAVTLAGLSVAASGVVVHGLPQLTAASRSTLPLLIVAAPGAVRLLTSVAGATTPLATTAAAATTPRLTATAASTLPLLTPS